MIIVAMMFAFAQYLPPIALAYIIVMLHWLLIALTVATLLYA